MTFGCTVPASRYHLKARTGDEKGKILDHLPSKKLEAQKCAGGRNNRGTVVTLYLLAAVKRYLVLCRDRWRWDPNLSMTVDDRVTFVFTQPPTLERLFLGGLL